MKTRKFHKILTVGAAIALMLPGLTRAADLTDVRSEEHNV